MLPAVVTKRSAKQKTEENMACTLITLCARILCAIFPNIKLFACLALNCVAVQLLENKIDKVNLGRAKNVDGTKRALVSSQKREMSLSNRFKWF